MATKTVIETVCSGCEKVHRDDDPKKVSSLALKKYGAPPEGWYLVTDANNEMHHVCNECGRHLHDLFRKPEQEEFDLTPAPIPTAVVNSGCDIGTPGA